MTSAIGDDLVATWSGRVAGTSLCLAASRPGLEFTIARRSVSSEPPGTHRGQGQNASSATIAITTRLEPAASAPAAGLHRRNAR